MTARRIGVLALQGATAPHVDALAALGAAPILVRTPGDVEGLDGLVLPGGESTTLSMLLASSGLAAPLGALISDGLPVLGTCAGMILLATDVRDGRPDQVGFGALDIAVRRNGFGRQVDSFEAALDITGLDAPFPAVFIRAPLVEATGVGVDVLATVDDIPVVVRAGPILATAFHPELTDDVRLHALFLDLTTGRRPDHWSSA